MGRRRIEPGQGQESVWDYPRPPSLEDVDKKIKVVFGGITLAYTRRAKRVLETSHPPVYYIPPEDVRSEYLTLTPRTTFCEWKGPAAYYTLTVGDKAAPNVAWSYPDPVPAFREIAGYLAFYPAPMDACLVDGERARP